MALTSQDRMYIEQRVANDAKSPLVAYLLWFFLGYFGVHRFYLGRSGTGVIMLLLTIVGIVLAFVMVGFVLIGIVAIWWLIDALLIPGIIDSDKRQLRRRLENDHGGESPALTSIDTSKWSKRDRDEHARSLRLQGGGRDVEPRME